MCGIMAVKGNDACNEVITGLEKLEYRGYDSCGIACKNNHTIQIKKAVGYVNVLADMLDDTSSSICIGHTRWATHGGVNLANSHPHISNDSKFAVVHNGIIENYKELKQELSEYNFLSDTDTEVIPILMQKYYTGSVLDTFRLVVSKLSGSFAIVLINTYDNNIYFARCSSPIIISQNNNNWHISSDINGLNNKTNIVYIPDNTYGYIDNKLHIFDTFDKQVNYEYNDASSYSSQVSKDGYAHYMLKEIFEIPQSLKNTFVEFNTRQFQLPKKINNILIVACGTSYHSALIGKKYIETYANIPTECEIASEFIYNNYLVKENTLAIFISQSGETADTLAALSKAKKLGLFTLAITNVNNSSISRESDECLYMQAGAEIAVASTKAYTCQILMLLLLSNVLINHRLSIFTTNKHNKNTITVCPSDIIPHLQIADSDFDDLFNIDILYISTEAKSLVSNITIPKQIHLIGKDYDYITALEGSLKIKEISYIFTDAYPCGELKHGTLSLIEKNSCVIAISTQKDLINKNQNTINEITARGGNVIHITDLEDYNENNTILKLPHLNPIFMPIVSIVALDLIAYQISTKLGYNPDKPRNLAKSVTVE